MLQKGNSDVPENLENAGESDELEPLGLGWSTVSSRKYVTGLVDDALMG